MLYAAEFMMEMKTSIMHAIFWNKSNTWIRLYCNLYAFVVLNSIEWQLHCNWIKKLSVFLKKNSISCTFPDFDSRINDSENDCICRRIISLKACKSALWFWNEKWTKVTGCSKFHIYLKVYTYHFHRRLSAGNIVCLILDPNDFGMKALLRKHSTFHYVNDFWSIFVIFLDRNTQLTLLQNKRCDQY